MATYEKKLVNLGYMPLKYLRLTPKTSKVIQNRKRDIFFSGHGTQGELSFVFPATWSQEKVGCKKKEETHFDN